MHSRSGARTIEGRTPDTDGQGRIQRFRCGAAVRDRRASSPAVLERQLDLHEEVVEQVSVGFRRQEGMDLRGTDSR